MIKVKIVNSSAANESFEFNSYKDLIAFAMRRDLETKIEPTIDPLRFYDAMNDFTHELSPKKKKKHLLARLLGL